MSDKAIVPAVRMGEFYLGSSAKDVMGLLERDGISYSIEHLPSREKLVTDDLMLWVRDGKITQITAYNGYSGKINGSVGIGSTLVQAEESLGRIREGEYDIAPTYEVEGMSGVCFELKDDAEAEDFDETTAPIEFISIY